MTYEVKLVNERESFDKYKQRITNGKSSSVAGPETTTSKMTNDGDEENHQSKGFSTADIGDDGKVLKVSDVKYREREKWGNKFEFILACMGFSVGLGNVWRFPYLAYKNGGGAFLLPYLFCLICGGVPMYFLEVALGQYTGQGGVTAWDICPLFKGIGYGTTVVVFYLNIFYVIILAWAILYLYYSFTSSLPWASCENTWNTPYCYSLEKVEKLAAKNITYREHIEHLRNLSGNNENFTDFLAKSKGWDAATEFWERKILQLSSGIEEIGSVRWELAITLFIAWVLCYFCIWKGVKSSGKVVYFTATFPYVMLVILFIRGVTLDGAVDGIIYYLNPDFSRLMDSQVWIDAGTQIFFSYAVALGCIVALGSYNDFHNNFYKDCIFLTVANSCTSVFSGFVIFSVLGFMAKEQQVDIKYVAESGPGLAFVAYPKAVAQMPLSPLWAVLFFFMILILGIDSQFVGVEGFITAVVDIFPNYLRYGYRREIFIGLVSILSYILGLFCITEGGIYVFELMNYYSASGVCLLWFCFFESIVVAWIYGGRRFYGNIKEMIGYTPNPILLYSWRFLTPACCLFVFLFSCAEFKQLTYNDIYKYPGWAVAIGWVMALSSMVCIPFYMIYIIYVTPGTLRERIRYLLIPKVKSGTNSVTTVIADDKESMALKVIDRDEPPPDYSQSVET